MCKDYWNLRASKKIYAYPPLYKRVLDVCIPTSLYLSICGTYESYYM